MNKAKNSQYPVSRRGFLGTLIGVSGALILPNAYAAPVDAADRALSFFNTHTGEKLTTTYWAEGQYQMDGLKDIGWLLRDHRADEAHAMDPRLIDMLYAIQNRVESQNRPFHIISGYRSPQTNAKLRRHSSGVAKKSYHMQGKAIDIRVPGINTAQLRKAALSLKSGGVGYYSKSNFIHLDTGRARAW
jgi:uncharacterized protein YcbK (DUF882 family)